MVGFIQEEVWGMPKKYFQKRCGNFNLTLKYLGRIQTESKLSN